MDIERLLSTGRMVTLVGVGGTGKTRLAIHAAADVVERYANGAWLVELAPLTDAELVVAEIGRALRVQPQPGQPPLETLVDYLRSKELLLVLDNCEHLIETVADVAYRLLGSCSGLRILTSSREPLGIDGEGVYAVPSLTLPAGLDADRAHAPADAEELAQAGRSEAVSLFVERARSILPSFALDASNVGAVVEICRRLDGIPLHALRRSGALDAAEAEYRETIHGWQHSGNRGAMANQLEAIAFLALARGNGVRGARLLGAAEALREVAGAPMTAQERLEYDGELLRLRAQLEEAALGEHWAEGCAMSSDEAVAVARAG